MEIMTAGYVKVGWLDIASRPTVNVGQDELSYAFDGYLAKKWHGQPEPYGKPWKIGDVVGCFLDLNDKTISFSVG